MSSFSVRPVYKPRFSGHVDLQEKRRNREKLEKVMETVGKFSRKSGHSSLVSASALRELIKSSSINPDFNPRTRKLFDDMINQKSRENVLASKDQKHYNQSFGFSTSSNAQTNSSKLSDVIDQELSKIPEDSSSEETQEELKNVKNPSFNQSARASLSRGFYRSNSMVGACVRKTALGVADGF